MKLRLPVLLRPAALAAALVAPLLAAAVPARAELVLPRVSPHAVLEQTIGVTEINIGYHRPGVKNRTIWGDLVPYDKPWRTGANDATTFATSTELMVGKEKLPAGKYSFFTIPSQGEWTVIFSKQANLWGAYEYDPSQDALRVRVTPTTNNEHTEWMQFTFENMTPNSGELVLRWEKLRLAVPVSIDVEGTVLSGIRSEMGNLKSDDWRTPYRAASWAFESNVALGEAAGWLDKSLSIQKAFPNLGLKARWLAKDGKTKEAVATGNEAIAVGKKATPPADTASLEKLVAEWSGKK